MGWRSAGGGVEQRQVADAGEAHLQRAGDGRGREREHVHVGPQRLDGLLVADAEALLLVHHQQAYAFIKFLSLEPLLGPLEKLNLENIDWAIVGGESGPGARPMKEEWVINIRDQCKKAGVAFFFKQWGGVNKKKTGRKLEGRTWDDMPKIKVDA